MGRAGRPTSNKTEFDPLRELREEGLPSGWEAYWQGERGEINEEKSKLAGDTNLLDLAPLSRQEWVERMIQTDWGKGATLRDPAFEDLWQVEMIKLTKLAEKIEEQTGQPSALRNLDLSLLRKKWNEEFVKKFLLFVEGEAELPPGSALYYLHGAMDVATQNQLRKELLELDDIEELLREEGASLIAAELEIGDLQLMALSAWGYKGVLPEDITYNLSQLSGWDPSFLSADTNMLYFDLARSYWNNMCRKARGENPDFELIIKQGVKNYAHRTIRDQWSATAVNDEWSELWADAEEAVLDANNREIDLGDAREIIWEAIAEIDYQDLDDWCAGKRSFEDILFDVI